MSDRVSGQVVKSNVTGSSVIKTGAGRVAMIGIVTAESLCFNQGGTTVAGNNINIDFQWSEQ